ncbi:MAG: hypothetical protein JNM56_27185 [Planctomycetia bacterium]|nr:hypothetical protein [Planctomycetia bacterium]
METRGRLSLGQYTALCTGIAVVVILCTSGQQMFSPGALSAQGRAGVTLGGVTSHAALAADCSACHAPPWSGETMEARCLACHTDIRRQIDAAGPLHGLLSQATHCRQCHTEHHGTHAALTDLTHFDHAWAAFKLTGKHRMAACASCHLNNVYQGTPHACSSCHAEPQVHLGKFGLDCARCHTTAAWDDVTFAHRFPMNHGGGGKRNKACVTCHVESDYRTYTCYGCHRHDPIKTASQHLKKGFATEANLQRCAECHPNGRKHRQRAAGDHPWPNLLAAGSACTHGQEADLALAWWFEPADGDLAAVARTAGSPAAHRPRALAQPVLLDWRAAGPERGRALFEWLQP